MPQIISIATANPPNVITQESVIEFAKSIYGGNKIFEHMLPVFLMPPSIRGTWLWI